MTETALRAELDRALAGGDGIAGAHAIHDLWMRGEMGILVERELAALWTRAATSIPEWLPMRYVDRLAEIYEITGRFAGAGRGRYHVYLVLLDYADSRPDPHGLYVGISHYAPAERFDQHKAGIRAAGFFVQGGH